MIPFIFFQSQPGVHSFTHQRKGLFGSEQCLRFDNMLLSRFPVVYEDLPFGACMRWFTQQQLDEEDEA